MQYLLLILNILILVFLIILLVRKNNNSEMIEKLGNFETKINKEIGDFKYDFSKNLNNDFEKLNDKIEIKLNQINNEVNSKLDKNFDRSNRTFSAVLERIARIDEAQKKIDDLSGEIVSLQSVLTDKKTRGTFGEVNLEYILNNAFGSSKTGIYKTQYKFSNNAICDALLYAPAPLGTIAIDSKFPLENYQKMTDKSKDKDFRLSYEKLFVSDLKKHINDISMKYILPGETTSEAIMFLPAEAIFAEINAYHPEVINYAYEKRVWITGPTTLMSTLSIVSMVLKNMQRDKYAKVIHQELGKLSIEFTRYKDRWERFAKDVKNVNSRIDEIQITSDKISKRFEYINTVDVEKLEYVEEKE